MAKRINPTINTFQERILIAKAHMDSTTPAVLMKKAIGDMIVRMSIIQISMYQKHYDSMTENEKKYTEK